ncbi:hypothetical protein V5799_025628 [Amblyomma americanum]|uniref:Uncharacterized protein n=1 Tax=Amblyomma americanum TaxID=6943 RepID=A0AAQ4E8Q9_AMBAM
MLSLPIVCSKTRRRLPRVLPHGWPLVKRSGQEEDHNLPSGRKNARHRLSCVPYFDCRLSSFDHLLQEH